MSASREKNKRRELAQNPELNVSEQPKKGMSKGLKTGLTVVITAVVLAVIIFFYMLTTGFFATHTTAATIQDDKLSPVMVNYFYKDAYNYMVQQWGDFASYMIDMETPLDEQIFDETAGTTYADYFIDMGLQSAAQIYPLYNEAKKNGFALSEEQLNTIDTQLNMMETYGQMYGLGSANAYIAAMYGKGCNEKNYREYLILNTTAEAYAASVNESLTYTADELATEYAANPNDYDGVTYRAFTFLAGDFMEPVAEGTEQTEEEKEAATAAGNEKAKAAAEAMLVAVGSDEAAFIAQCKENATEANKTYYEDDNYSLRTDLGYDEVPAAAAEWLFDTARVAGDTQYVFADNGTHYVLFFLNRDNHDYGMPNVRHILFSVDQSADDATKAATLVKAQAALDAYKQGELTEEAFTALGDGYLKSSEASEATRYDEIFPGQMVSEFENWCYDLSRQTGDTGIVETSYGFHVMYFCGRSDANTRDYLVETALRGEEFSAWQNGVIGEMAAEKVNFGMKFVTK